MINSLLRKEGETLDQYRSRFRVSTAVSPTISTNEQDIESIITKTCDDKDTREILLDHALNGGLDEDMMTIYQIGLLMVHNPIQLIRFSEALKLEHDTRKILDDDESMLDQILQAQMVVLRDKAMRAKNIVQEYDGMEESPFSDPRMSDHWVGTKDVMSLKQVAIAIIDAKAKAIAGLRTLQDTLAKIYEIEKKTKI